MRGRALRRSLSDFKRHPWLHFISISTITAALVIQGGFLLTFQNFERVAETTNPNVSGTVYLIEGLPAAEVSALREKVLSQPYVAKVIFKNADSVVQDLQSFLGNSEKGMPGADLFPDVFELEVKRDAPAGSVSVLKSAVARMPGVAEVDFSEDWLVQYKKVRQFLAGFGVVLSIAILIGCGFIIANFMGMRHQSRKYEIDVVRLIGASRKFVMAPFLWEGVIEGLLGTAVAMAMLYLFMSMISAALSVQWISFLGIKQLAFLSLGQCLLILVIGLAMALFGSVTVFLRFKEGATK